MSTITAAPLTYTSRHPAHTQALGQTLGQLLRPGDVICLSGDLGAGKTAFTQGIGRGWGALEPVTSPTFVLIHEHRRQADSAILYHVDCYRLRGPADAWGIGLEDLWHSEGCVVIEWPENIQAALPAEHLWVTFSIEGEQQRQLLFEARGERYQALLSALQTRVPSTVLP
ncbi:MAG: tRNA (adenosine(37)-N6)-threonylcarbamoyltransferase complex ATPase subunit type 1 TsaE [Anaerolineae bacterium]